MPYHLFSGVMVCSVMGHRGGYYLDRATAGQAAAAEREIDRERAGGERLDLHFVRVAEPHDGAFAELFGDDGDGEIDVFARGGLGGGGGGFGSGCGFGHGGTGRVES